MVNSMGRLPARLTHVAGAAALALVYYALARFGMSISFIDPVASPVWPAAGVAVGVLLIFGWRLWPGILVGETVAVWQTSHWSAAGFGPAILSGAGDVAEALLIMWLCAKWMESKPLRKPWDIVRFALVVALAGTLAATAGTAGRLWSGARMADAGRIWGTWWIGDVGAILVLAPLLVAWARPWTVDDPDRSRPRFWVSAAVLCAMSLGILYIDSQPPSTNYVLTTALGYMTIGALVWAIGFLGLRGTTAIYFVLAAASIIGIYHGRITGAQTADVALLTSVAGLGIFQLAMVPIGFLVEDRRKNRRDLETRVAERTRELAATNADLRIAKEQAEAATRAKSSFLATMSHEIRTPLNAVIGTAELLAGTRMAKDQLESLQTIRTSGEHLLTVINDVLDYSKAEAGRMRLDPTSMDLKRVAEEAMILARAQMGRSKALVVHLRTEGPMQIVADPHRVRQILLNYLSNAMKFTHEGTINVEVTTKPVGAAAQVEIKVTDTGIGIPPARLGELFQPFSQIAPALTRTTGGTGLGLAILKRVVDTMGGSVGVKSQVGKGSTFTASFTAPLAAPGVAALVGAAPSSGSAHPLHILLAEDNAVNRKVATQMLARLGQQADVAVDGREALNKALASPYDLVLMDVHMPELDGLEATRQLRRLERDRHTRIVAMTADALAEDRARCLAAGMDDYIAKPVRIADMQHALAGAGA
jgi:signal transduction histidine kinase